MRNFAALEPSFLMLRQGMALPTVDSIFQLHLIRRTGDNSRKLCSPGALEPRGEEAELVAPREKPVPGIEDSCAMHREGD